MVTYQIFGQPNRMWFLVFGLVDLMTNCVEQNKLHPQCEPPPQRHHSVELSQFELSSKKEKSV